MRKELSFIWTRRSVRSFTPEPVPEDLIRELLSAAMSGPSACCKDPWEFLVLREKEDLARVASCLPNGSFLADASLGILVCGDLGRAHSEAISYMIQDCSAAIENLLLAANALGLGGCWLGIHPREERIAALGEIFRFPGKVIPLGAVALGYPVSRPEPRTRFNPARVHEPSDWRR